MSPGLDEEPQRLFLVTAKAPANWYGGVDLRSRKKVKLPCLEPHMRVVLVFSDDLTGLTLRKCNVYSNGDSVYIRRIQ